MENDFELASTKLETYFGSYDFQCYSWGDHEEDNVLCLSNLTSTENVLVRVQSACYTAEIFRSLDCDCHEQLETSLKRIKTEGGLLIYMLCDGRGAGLLNKIKGLELGRTKGLDTSDAYKELRIAQDPREYEKATKIIKHLGIKSIRLLTNNPRKVEGLKKSGIEVIREELEILATQHSKPYLETKAKKMGHLMSQFNNLNKQEL